MLTEIRKAGGQFQFMVLPPVQHIRKFTFQDHLPFSRGKYTDHKHFR